MRTVFNPDEARHFADWLEEESAMMMMMDVRDTSRVIVELQARWNDAKYNDYLRIFDSNTEEFSRFGEHVERYVSYLRKKADIISDYFG